MTRRILTDSTGNECRFMYDDQPRQRATTGVYVEVCAEGEVISAGPFTPEALHAALDTVAPASSGTRIRSLRNDRHYWQTRAEKAERRACPDLDAHWRLDEAMARAEKAEKELREQGQDLAELAAGQRRPITADDIESVLHSILPLSTEHLGADDVADIASDLYTALTEPPRPEGAEELEADMEAWYIGNGTSVGGTGDRLADHLAALGYRKTGDES